MLSNNPPLADRLEIDHAALAAHVADVLALDALPPIFGDDDLVPYSERAKLLKQAAGVVEKARKQEKDSILQAGRTVDDWFARLAAPLKAAADTVVAAINAHQRKMLEEKRKADEAARREAEERAKAQATPFDDPTPEPVVMPVKAAEAVRVVSSTGRVAATASTVWRHEVTDPAAVPRQFLMVNETAIKAAIAGGMREIPGCRIYEDLKTVVR
jgi:hypothetical protein